MPVIAGRYYMNPAHGAEIERARQAEEDERMGGARGLPAQAGKAVHRVEIECADGGYVARLHRHPGQGAGRDEEGRFRPGESPATRPSVHVFTNHNDLVDFLREELGK
jgi:hypothetical protein